MTRVLTFAAALLFASASAAQSVFEPGTLVLASPLQMDSSWYHCVVLKVPQGYSGYELECADEYRGTTGLIKKLDKITVPAKWVKADDPNVRPDLTVAAARAAIAKAAAAPKPTPAPVPANGAAKSVVPGNYECWAFSTARMNLNFTVTAPGKYRASDGSTSTFTFEPATGLVTFAGYLKDAMPSGFTAIYHEPRGTPTVSFRSPRGSEASFCEKAK
jgi:hypothetical protein